MKRDMNLIRDILLAAEAQDPLAENPGPFEIAGVDPRVFARHVELLVDAGLLRAHVISSDQTGPLNAILDQLTWNGYEFLDAARDDTAWHKGLTVVKEKAGAVSFEVLKLYLVAQAKALIGIP